MFRLFRKLEVGEFFCVGGDTSQGGIDSNFTQFGSRTRSDIPLVLQFRGVAAEATPMIREALIWIYKQTKVKPVVCLERNNGGASEMHHLVKYNTGEYVIYYARNEQGIPTDQPGWNTTTVSRPRMLGDWLMAYESRAITIYDKETQDQHQTFVVNKNGKPEASPGTHDDAVMSAAIMWQLMQQCNPAPSEKQTGRLPRSNNVAEYWGGAAPSSSPQPVNTGVANPLDLSDFGL